MTLLMPCPSESSGPTLNWQASPQSEPTTKFASEQTIVVNLADRVPAVQVRPGFIPLSKLASRLADIPGREAALVRAREDIGKLLSSHGKEDLRAFRLSRGLSQTAFAEQIGSSQPYVARIEKNPACAGLEFMRKLCSAFSIDMNTANELLK